MVWLVLIINVLAIFIDNMVNVVVATPKNDRQQSVNDHGCYILYNPRAVLWLLLIIKVLATFIGIMVNVVVGHFPELHYANNVYTWSPNNFWSFT